MYKRLRFDAIDQGLLNQAAIRPNRKGLRRKPPRWMEPAAIERQYNAQLQKLVDEFFAYVDATMGATLPLAINEHNTQTMGLDSRTDGWADTIQRAVRSIELRAQDFTERARQLALNIGIETSNFNRQQLLRIMRSTLGVDVFKSEPWLQGEIESWVAENVTLIKSIPGQALTTIEGLAQRGVRSGASASDIAKQIRERYGVTKSRAKLIARDQVAKLNGDLTQKRQKSLGIQYYTWESSRDERVRPTHDEMQGKLCRWDDPTVYSDDGGKTWKKRSSIGGVQLHPGYDYQCRCSASPALDQVFEQLGI